MIQSSERLLPMSCKMVSMKFETSKENEFFRIFMEIHVIASKGDLVKIHLHSYK